MTDPTDKPDPKADDTGSVATTPIAPKRQTFFPSLTTFKPPKSGAPRIPIRVMCFHVLKEAGQDPWDWYRKFADSTFTFLGRKFDGAIHEDLAEHLRAKEKAFIEAARKKGRGDDEDDDNDNADEFDAFEAGTALGLAGPPGRKNGIDLLGARKKPTAASISMHFFGLAMDIDYDFNFYPEEKGRESLTRVLQKARLILESEEAEEDAPGLPWGWPKTKNGNSFKNLKYDEIVSLNENLLRYTGLLEDDDALLTLLGAAKAAPWSTLDLAEAKELIETHAGGFCATLGRPKSLSKVIATVKATGFMTMSKEIVDGMDLDWGGVYGDTMHFDARNLAQGKKIQDAIRAFKKDGAAQKRLADHWKPFVGKSEEDMLAELVDVYPKP